MAPKVQFRGIMIAIPLFGSDVAPRFGYEKDILIADLHRSEFSKVQVVHVPQIGWSCRLQHMTGLGVSVLLCGGFDRRFLPFVRSLGIQVVSGLTGKAYHLIEAFWHDELDKSMLTDSRSSGRSSK
jgi:predicted Fe-Mo cluster-binding NifX family protein